MQTSLFDFMHAYTITHLLQHIVELPDVVDVHNAHVFEQNFFNTGSLQNRSGNLSQHSDFSKFWLEMLHVAHSQVSHWV